MFLSPEVIIVCEFPRDSLGRSNVESPVTTLFSTHFVPTTFFLVSRVDSYPSRVLDGIESKSGRNILRLKDYEMFLCKRFSVLSEKGIALEYSWPNLRTKAQLYEIPRLSSVTWFWSPPSHLPPYFAILARISPLWTSTKFRVFEAVRCRLSLRDLARNCSLHLTKTVLVSLRYY